MKAILNHNNEDQVAIAFNHQSAGFDDLYGLNTIIQYKRERVRERLLSYLKPESHILEINAGTGEDAVFLAKQGHWVHATDISEGMQDRLTEKVTNAGFSDKVSFERCSFTVLDRLKNKGPYDCIFSNFAGLNCTNQLGQILNGFDSLLKPGALVMMVILPKFCLWETLLFFRGKFKTATRRFFSSRGRMAKIDGFPFRCWYYSPGFIKRIMKDKYTLLGMEGLCTTVPPSYMENFPEKYPGIYSFLCRTEKKLCRKWPWNYIGDYYIASFIKK